MVNMNSIVAVLFLAVAVQAKFTDVENIIDTPGKQYEIYREYIQTVKLTSDAENDVFKGLNIAGGDSVDQNDLNLFYWHEELKFAIPRVFTLLEDGKEDKQILKTELTNDLKKPHIAVALIECTYLLSPGLRRSCFADQLLTYAALALGKKDVKNFFGSLDKDPIKGQISEKELEVIKKSKDTHDLKIVFEELGGNDGDTITEAEFTEYVIQESLNDDFRECRKTGLVDAATGNVEFNSDCLQTELVEYANDDLTEMDISVLFRSLDTNGNGKITLEEIKVFDENKFGSDNKAKRVMVLLDMSLTTREGEIPEIDYGEFRTYTRSPTVLVQLERECTETKTLQKDEIKCLVELLTKLLDEEHDPIWLVVPDLDQTSAFESLDTDNNGKITEAELKLFKFTNQLTRSRFIAEADNSKGGDVCLEEFNEYVDIPHMVYGTADCLLEPRNEPTKRGDCYTREISDIIDNFRFFDDKAWDSWFNFFDSKNDGVINNKDDIDGKLKKQGLKELFLKELGQGGDSVLLFEFKWYVKQQELADHYDKQITAPANSLDDSKIIKLNVYLVEWIEEYVTEYDIQQFFDRLDIKVKDRKDHELKENDFDANVWKIVLPLIQKIDKIEPGTDGGTEINVNFREFWLWLHSKHGAGRVKDIFKKECAEPKTSQKDELECYEKTFKDAEKWV